MNRPAIRRVMTRHRPYHRRLEHAPLAKPLHFVGELANPMVGASRCAAGSCMSSFVLKRGARDLWLKVNYEHSPPSSQDR